MNIKKEFIQLLELIVSDKFIVNVSEIQQMSI